jgi:hypothetical protein
MAASDLRFAADTASLQAWARFDLFATGQRIYRVKL